MTDSRLFQPGSPGGPGRPKGSRNRLGEAFLEALYADFRVNGLAAIEAARAESPLGYCKMVASLLPQKLQIEKAEGKLSDDELLAIIRDGGREAGPVVRGDDEAVH